jgi:hypothetical protein
MKTLILITVIFTSSLCSAQWQDVNVWNVAGGTQTAIYGMGVHDTFLFISGAAVGNNFFYRYTPATGLQSVTNGIDFSQGNITSIAAVEQFEFAGIAGGRPVYRSSDNGSHWQINAGGPVGTNGEYLFGTYVEPFQIIRSTDDGGTWDSITNTTSQILSFSSDSTIIFAQTSSVAYRSSDTGAHWSEITLPSGDTLSAFSSLGTQFFSGGAGIFRSMDYGLNWTQISLGSRNVISLITYKTYLFAGTDTGIFISSDSGVSWRNVSDNMGAQSGYHPRVTNLAIIDTMLYAAVDAGRNSGADFPYGYVAVRPISEMTDTAQSMVVQTGPSSDTLSIYPNPATGTVTIISGGTSIYGITVLDILGEDVLDIPKVNEAELSIDISKLQSGTYFFQIQTSNGSVLRKVVIQH